MSSDPDWGYPGVRRRYQLTLRSRVASAAHERRRRATVATLNSRTGGLLGVESKFYDTYSTGVVAESVNMALMQVDPPLLGCVSAPAEGDGANQRDGRRILITSIQLKVNIYVLNSITGVAPANQSRAMVSLVWDKQTNGAQLNSEDVFTNPTAGINIATMPLRNMEYSSRFSVLKSWEIDLTPVSLFQAASGWCWNAKSATLECFLPLSLVVNFSGAAEGVASVVDNSLHLIANSNGQDTTTVIYYLSRVRFK